MKRGSRRDQIPAPEYVVGEEKSLAELFSHGEADRLFAPALAAGIRGIIVTGPDGTVLWRGGSGCAEAGNAEVRPLSIEGEDAGKLTVDFAPGSGLSGAAVADLLAGLLNAVIQNNLKRIITSEIHLKVVNDSYDELVEANRQLGASEARYRDLAESLDRKVKERTEELKQAYSRMVQQEKMASVGQLAAGMAHEINNPIGFIASNLHSLGKYMRNMASMIQAYRDSSADTGDLFRKLKIDAILSDIPDLIGQSIDGAQRIERIVAALKGFSHIEDRHDEDISLNDEIDRTLAVLSGDIPADAKIEKDFGSLPKVRGNPGLTCQAFMNIIKNSLQVKSTGLRLVISTVKKADEIEIRFTDNGPGIPEEIQGRIFEPFFTTKEVGQGMGLGLAVAYDIMRSCGGSLSVESRPGEGTTIKATFPARA